MKPRVTIITLGVDDLEKAVAFYRDGLGWQTPGIIGTRVRARGGCVLQSSARRATGTLASRQHVRSMRALTEGRAALRSSPSPITSTAPKTSTPQWRWPGGPARRSSRTQAKPSMAATLATSPTRMGTCGKSPAIPRSRSAINFHSYGAFIRRNFAIAAAIRE